MAITDWLVVSGSHSRSGRVPVRKPQALPINLWALPGTVSTMYLANTWLVAIVIGLQRRESPLDVWRTGRRRAVLQEAGLYLLGLITARTAVQDPWIPLLMVLPVAIV